MFSNVACMNIKVAILQEFCRLGKSGHTCLTNTTTSPGTKLASWLMDIFGNLFGGHAVKSRSYILCGVSDPDQKTAG